MSNSAGISNNQKRFYGVLVTILFIFSLVGGLIGFRSYFLLLEGEEFNWLRSIYCTLQLFTLESGDLKSPVPLILNIARFTAPITTVMTFIIALLEIFKDRWMKMIALSVLIVVRRYHLVKNPALNPHPLFQKRIIKCR